MATRVTGAIVAVCLVAVSACSSDDDDTTAATSATVDLTTIDADDVDEGASDEPASTVEPAAPTSTEPSAPAASTSSSPGEVQLLDLESQPVPAGRYRVETLGAPFLIDVPEGWWVQINSFGHFVITEAASRGPGDRDIVMIRPSNLADPDRPGAPVDEQTGDWPLDDIDGWLDALIPGVVDGEPVATTIGGLDAVQFDVAIADEVECGEFFCVGFATNRMVNDLTFDRGKRYRVWWIDGGDESPIAISVGSGPDPDFTARAQTVLDTVSFEAVGANPIPSEGNLWELGFPSEVPTGIVTLPVGPSVTFEVSEPYFVLQNEYFARVLLDGPGEADIFFPDEAFDGEPIDAVDDVVGALERAPGLTATIVGTREVGGYEATEMDISGGAVPGADAPPLLGRSVLPDGGWRAPPDGTLWIMETPDGIAVVTAEWVRPSAREVARALATEILDSIVIGG